MDNQIVEIDESTKKYSRFNQRRHHSTDVKKIQTVGSTDISKIYEVLDFKEEAYIANNNNQLGRLKEYVNNQARDIYNVKYRKRSYKSKNQILTDTESYSNKIPTINEVLDGRTIQNMIKQNHQSKQKVTDIIMQLERFKTTLNTECTMSPVNKTCNFQSFNPEIQNIEIEQFFTFHNSDQESMIHQPIYMSKNKVNRNSFYNPKQENGSMNLQNVKEKLIFDMLRENFKCDLVPLRLQLFNLSNILARNKKLRMDKEKQVLDLVKKSDTHRNDTVSEKRELYKPSVMKFSYREQNTVRNQLNKSLDERMNKNEFQIKQFNKLLQHLRDSSIEISKDVRGQLSRLRQILLSGRPLNFSDILDENSQVIKLIINNLKIQ